MKATRRTMIAGGFMGALAVPTIAGMAQYRWKFGESTALVHDSSLEAGRRFAAAALANDKAGNSQEIAGDRVRFMREVLAQKPALIAGISRPADHMLLADIARESGYVEAATLHVRQGRCTGHQCQKGWGALARLGKTSGSNWAEALADFAINPGGAIAGASAASWAGAQDRGLVLGWVLAPRG